MLWILSIIGLIVVVLVIALALAIGSAAAFVAFVRFVVLN